jgi:hypothetical protein
MTALSSYERQIHLMRQIHEAGYYIRKAEELGHPHLWTSYDLLLDFLGNFKGALNSYAKCFVSAGKGRIRLDASSIFNAENPRLEQHKRIMNLRHTFVAHNDENEFESVAVSHEDSPTELVLHLAFQITFPFDRFYELRDLILLVENHVVDRQTGYLSAIEREVGKPVRVLEGGIELA